MSGIILLFPQPVHLSDFWQIVGVMNKGDPDLAGMYDKQDVRSIRVYIPIPTESFMMLLLFCLLCRVGMFLLRWV